MANFRVDVDSNGVVRKIRRRIEDGVDRGADELAHSIEKVAKGRIRRKGAVWRHHLLEGFEDTTLNFGDRTRLSVLNVSDHASEQEHGVSGTQVKRDTPHGYKNKKPPLEALIPWVRDHLTGTGFDPYGYGPGGGSSGSDSGGSDDDDGAAVTTDDYDPLMGADQLDEGTTGVQYQLPNGDYETGEITNVFSDDVDSVDYRITKSDGSLQDIKQEWVQRWDGKGASPSEVSVGEEVYVGGNTNKFGVIVDTNKDPETGEITGAYVDTSGDGAHNDLYSLEQFQVVTEENLGALNDGAILKDKNGLYVPSKNFREIGKTATFDLSETHPYQQVVVLDYTTKNYRRGEIVGYPEPGKIRVQFDDDDGIVELKNDNTHRNFSVVGARFYDSLTESEKKNKLSDYFNEEIIGAHTDSVPQDLMSNGPYKDPTQGRLEETRDTWIQDVWEDYDDDWVIKEHIRNIDWQLGLEDSTFQAGTLGGIINPLDEKTNYGVALGSKTSVSNKQGLTESYYKSVLRHESAHATSRIHKFGTAEGPPDKEKVFSESEWTSTGLNNNAHPDIPSDAKLVMFRDKETGDLVGGKAWMKDAYNAAQNLDSGIKNYSPNLQTPKSEKYKRFHEAANHAYWLQAVAGQKKYDRDGSIDTGDDIFIQARYSGTNAPETYATLQHVLTGQDESWVERIETLDEYYPWLIEAWLEFGNPSPQAASKLEDLGYNV